MKKEQYEIYLKKLKILIKKRKGDPAYLRADIKMAQKVLKWYPKHSSLDNIIKTAYLWYLKKNKLEIK